jgi:hypothetical protein
MVDILDFRGAPGEHGDANEASDYKISGPTDHVAGASSHGPRCTIGSCDVLLTF